MAFMQVAYLVFSILTDVGIIASGAKSAAIIIPFLAVVLYYLQKFYLRTSRKIRYLDLEAKSPLYTQFIETAAGLQHIRAFGWQSQEIARSLELLDYSQKPYYYMFCIQRWLELILDLCILVIAVVLVSFALTTGSSQAAIGLALVNIMTLSEALSQLIKSWIDLETSLGAIARLRTFQLPEKTPVEEDSFCVQDAQLPAPELAGPGHKVGIVGRTGRQVTGKSSLLSFILRLLDSSSQIWIDGVDVSHISRQYLHSQITTLPQDPILLTGSVRDNLNPFHKTGRQVESNSFEEADMVKALIQVDLWRQISSREGLDTELSSLGLSHGQKQLLCLARAVLHNASTGSRVVLIDEATSNLDGDTDARAQAVLSEAFAGCTQLVVAHRLETIRDADVIVELSEGKVVRMTRRDAAR
ncbi:hypothetical protein HIM_06830 [Hirsutella minnesotensis 3608]|uniref:ABC transmembrane type-1 domain-containing protein n=1 Tax=Hirsutella minnesotensis 3608 TaxID=1043627 RepID=A0A0F7ZZ71_9HYPO|nr:hypothetical protein HIM_06830 [Hirsutella minnesotensis 3608]